MRLAENTHKTGCGQIGRDETAALSGRACHGFGGEVAAADRAFHRGGPSGCGPVAGEEDAWPCRGGGGTVSVDAWPGGVGRVDFLDDRGLYQCGFASGGKELTNFREG